MRKKKSPTMPPLKVFGDYVIVQTNLVSAFTTAIDPRPHKLFFFIIHIYKILNTADPE